MKKLLLIAVLLAPAGAVAQISTGTVSGEIRTREGQPAVGVRVSAMASPEAGAPANSGTALVSIGMTDNQGRYRLENVLPGRYYITAGFVDTPTYYPGVTAVSGATVVNVLSSTPVTGINFAVVNTVGVTVSGRVRSATGTLGVGGQPVAMTGGNSPIQHANTAADGSFQFLRVRPGRYQLTSAFPVGGRTNQLPVVVGDQDVTGLEILVIPTVNVTGNVVIEGNPIRPRLQLLLSSLQGTGQNTYIWMQPDGTLGARLTEGDYRVSWSGLPVGYEIKSITSGSLDLLSNSLKVAVDTPPSPIRVLLTNLIIPLPWTKDIPGTVLNATGAGVQGQLSLRYSQRNANASSSGLRTIATQPDGKFTIQVSEGDVQVSVTVPGYTVKSLTYGTTDLTRESMKVTAADTAELKVVLDTTSTTIATGGVVGAPPPPPPQPSALTTTTAINRVSPEVAQANLVTSVPPAYPPLATAARVQGNVVLQVEISIQGLVQNIRVLSGHPLLNEAAIQSVRQRTYKPFVFPVITTVTVNFTLP